MSRENCFVVTITDLSAAELAELVNVVNEFCGGHTMETLVIGVNL